MYRRAVLMLVLLGVPLPGLAQNAGGIELGGPSPPPQTCVQVEIAGQKNAAFNCLNQQLAAQARAAAAAPPSIPLTAAAPPDRTGTFSQTGLAEQYGKNLGKSVFPYRPPAPVFSNTLH